MMTEQKQISGRVVDQATGQGIAGVVVSNGLSVVQTDTRGVFVLPGNFKARFVFVSTPGQYAPVGTFYKQITTDHNHKLIEFVLKPSPVGNSFCFAQITDVHLHPTGQFKQSACNRLQPDEQFAVVTGVAREIAEFSPRPQFVAMTGDLAVAINSSSIPEATSKVKFYLRSRDKFELPMYDLIGNHDHVFSALSDAELKSPEYGRGLFESYLGPTYYSFNCGNWHFVALNNYEMEDRTQHVRVGPQQLSWLEADLAKLEKYTPCVIFMHELLPDIEDRDQLLAVTDKYNIKAFVSGHFHVNMDYQYRNARNLVTGALCAGWWWRPQWGTDRGYALFRVDADNLSRFFVTCGDPNAVEILQPASWSVVSGETELRAAVLEIKAPPTSVSCQIADRDFQAMTKAGIGPWPVWKHPFDLRSVDDGSVRIAIRTINTQGRTQTYHRYIIVKNHQVPIGSANGELLFSVTGSQGPSKVIFNGKKLGTIPYPSPDPIEACLPIPASLLHTVNVIEFRPVRLCRSNNTEEQFHLNYRSKPIPWRNGADEHDVFWFKDLRIRYDGHEYFSACYRPRANKLVDIERNDMRTAQKSVCIIPSAEQLATMVTTGN